MGGRQNKGFDPKTQDAVSLATVHALEARARQFLCVLVIALAIGTNTSFLDRLYRNQATMGTVTFSGLQLAKELDS